jgi:hypothetical protein
MSSLAFDDMQEQMQGPESLANFTPALQVVKPRRKSRSETLSLGDADLSEVVHIRGTFTVSF